MATGQTLLTIAALVLLAIISMGIQGMYLQSVDNTIDAQETSDALNFGRDLSEQLHSYSLKYDELINDYGNLEDVNDPGTRIEFTSQIGVTYYATIELSDEQMLFHNETGRLATINIFEEERNEYSLLTQYFVTITDL